MVKINSFTGFQASSKALDIAPGYLKAAQRSVQWFNCNMAFINYITIIIR
jgi:hypothetical protein